MTDKLKELLRGAFPLWDLRGANEEEHHCELALFHDRKRLHALLDKFDVPAVEAAEIEVVDDESRHESIMAIHRVLEAVPSASLYSFGEALVDAGYGILAGVNQQAGSWVPEGFVLLPVQCPSWLEDAYDESVRGLDHHGLFLPGYDAMVKALQEAAPLPPSPAAKAGEA